ncbi:tRNA pseudouridine(55) synthase TruB [bacterium]|nr:tRNA pseudouridine(55) synthase TruB [bacterium]
MASGWIILDKPTDMTSRTAGGRLRRLFGASTFGHIGTLDPMASGVLPIALGTATKMIPFMPGENTKEYLFALKFGMETDTLDITGQVVRTTDKTPERADVLAACGQLTGDIMQVPPMFSAVHVGGRRAYDLARQGKTVDMPARPVHIDALSLEKIEGDQWYFRVQCGAGTYVRSIGRDLGRLTGGLATVTMIRRIQTHGFGIKDAVTLDFLENWVHNGGDVRAYLHAPDFGLGDIPVINLADGAADLYRHGGFIDVMGTAPGLVRVYVGDTFIGMGCVTDGVLRPKRTL